MAKTEQAIINLEGEAGGNLQGGEPVARVEGVAKTECDEIPRPFGVQVDIGANIQHVIRKIASSRTRLEILTDARTAPEREDVVYIPFVAKRRFEVISDFSTAHFDSQFKGAAEKITPFTNVCAPSILILVSLGMSKLLGFRWTRLDCDLSGTRNGWARQGDLPHYYGRATEAPHIKTSLSHSKGLPRKCVPHVTATAPPRRRVLHSLVTSQRRPLDKTRLFVCVASQPRHFARRCNEPRQGTRHGRAVTAGWRR